LSPGAFFKIIVFLAFKNIQKSQANKGRCYFKCSHGQGRLV